MGVTRESNERCKDIIHFFDPGFPDYGDEIEYPTFVDIIFNHPCVGFLKILKLTLRIRLWGIIREKIA